MTADFDAFYRRHQRWLARYLATKVRRGDSDVVDDLAQVVFLRAWPALPGVQLAAVEVEKAWLCTITRRVVADHYLAADVRQRCREDATDPTDPAAWDADTSSADGDDADRVCVLVDLQRSMAAATPAQRQVVRLRVLDGLPWALIAGHTRQSKAGARRALAEATAGVIG